MDPSESLRAFPGEDTSQNLQAHADHQVYSNAMIASSDPYNFMTGRGGMDHVPLNKDHHPSQLQLQGPTMSEEVAAGGHAGPSGGLIGTLYTNQQHPLPSGEYPRHSPSTGVPIKSTWDNMNGGGMFSNSNLQNMLIGGTGMMTASTGAATAQLLIGGLQGGSFSGGGHGGDVGSVYYNAAGENQQEQIEHMYYVPPTTYNPSAGFHSDGSNVPGSASTMHYPTHDDGTATVVPQPSQCDVVQNQQQFRVDPFLAAAAGGIPLPLQDHLGSANPNYVNWRTGGNEHSFIPMNEDSQNHQSQFNTVDHHVPQFSISSQACHDLSQMHQTDHMTNMGVGLHMESLKGISVTGQGLSLSLSSDQSLFHSAGGHMPDQTDHMAVMGQQAAAMAKTKELASRYLAGNSADLSRFRTQSREDILMGSRFLQEHIDSAGQKHLASSTHICGASGVIGSSNTVSASRFLGSAQAILVEVCRVTAMKRNPKPAKSPEQQQPTWNNVAGGSSASVDGNSGARSSILTGVDSGRDSAAAFNIHTSPHVTVTHGTLESEMIQGLADAARAQNREDLESKKQKLSLMADEVEARYRRYCDQLQAVITIFNSQAGPNTATPYTILALQAMSRHFRCLRDGVGNQLKIVRRALGEDVDTGNAASGETSRLRYVDQQIRQQRALQQLGMLQQHAWRPQRGLPERAVSVLRAWLFEHFLHPYPKDVDKLSLAKQTGLTRSQVSNWFINARVRLWKPMVEEMYVEEQKESEQRQAAERLARIQAEIENGTYIEQLPEDNQGNSGLLHEVSGNAQTPRIPNIGLERSEDKEHVDNGPCNIITGVGGTITDQVPLHPDLVSIGQRLDVDLAGSYNEEVREAKKARSSPAPSDVFKPISSLMHPGMNAEGGKPEPEAVNFQGGDVHVNGDTNFGIPSQALNHLNNHDPNGYSHVSQQGTATVDHIQPHVGAGTFGAFDGHNIGHSSYGNHEPDLRGYVTQAVSATSTGTVSLTLGLRHCEVNQQRSSMVSPIIGNLSQPYNMVANEHINQLNRELDLYEGRIGDVSHNGQPTSTVISNGHYLQHAQDSNNSIIDNSNMNSNNSNSQQLSPNHREFNAAN